ncbi:ABC-type transporter cobalamide binding protein [uncultured Desulfatiglans sp.]|uniref:ABC-type transporter cobalamide binding protein n=1 Tax=Uncultured Desulfatiglans sp. TaxID=1748965 RepID=A0A653AB62_UNCDX|nr:ABC-type transporter cobalamide binding protein [uncultured Desulfatiglans sp.]
MLSSRSLFIGLFILVAFIARPASAAAFRDAMGRTVILDGPPRRIVSLAPSITEILYFLGLGERVAGVTQYSTYPPAALDKPKVGSYVNLNIERIISLAPDLVIATVDGNSRSVVDTLEAAGIQVFTTNPRNLFEALDTIALLGRVCGATRDGAAAAEALKVRAEDLAERVRALPRPKVFVQINLRPIMTVNRDTFLNDLITLAGGANPFSEEPFAYPRISLEEVIRQRPDVILVSSMDRGGRFEEARREWLRLEDIPAARNGRVHLIDSDLVDRPSPRIVDGLEEAARFIHPEIPWERP